MDLLPGLRSQTITTERLTLHYLESGPADGEPVVFIHGNLATSRFFEPLLAGLPARYHSLAPDMRGFGATDRVPIDATRGLRDWADDTYVLLQTLCIDRPVHLVGWSTGGGAIATYAIDHPAAVASLTLVDPVSPYGFGGIKRDGTPCAPDYAGSGGGTGSPDFAQRLAAGDRSAESPFSPRNVMNAAYWAPSHREPAAREDLLVDEILTAVIGVDGYPGDAVASEHWPGVAPGTRGILNALSGKYCDWSGIVALTPKPPILWTQGSADIVIADGSAWEMGSLGKAGLVPGWPGEEVFPPQPMVTQIRAVLERYREAGGRVEMVTLEGSGHTPFIDAPVQWATLFHAFLASVTATGSGPSPETTSR